MLPSFVLLCVMSAIYVEYGDVTAVAGIVRGLGAAVIALVAAAVIRVGRRVIHTAAARAWPPPASRDHRRRALPRSSSLVAALAGYLAGTRNPRLLGKPRGHGEDEDPTEAARATPACARRFVKTLAIWLVPVAILLLAGGFLAQLTGFLHPRRAHHLRWRRMPRPRSSPAPPSTTTAG